MIAGRDSWRRVACLGSGATAAGREAESRVRADLEDAGYELVDERAAAVGEADLIVVLGGDGFLMEVLERLDYPPTPIFGVNFGTVGFHMNPQACAGRIVDVVRHEPLEIQPYPVLAVDATLEDGSLARRQAFNDVILERDTRQSVRFRVSIDGVVYNRFAGDGFVVATPAGTTAYNLAAGGPAVHPNLEAITVTPLYPHRVLPFTSVQFSVVVPLSSEIEFFAEELPKRGVRLVTDGEPIFGVARATVRDAGRRVALVRVPERGFFQTLGQKIIGE